MNTGRRSSRFRRCHTYLYHHVVMEVVIACDQDVLCFILEDEPRALVQTIEVLDSGNDGIGSVVRRDHDSHWKTSAILALWEDKFKRDLLLLSCAR